MTGGLDERRRESARRLLPLLTAEERMGLRAELEVAEASDAMPDRALLAWHSETVFQAT